MRLAYEARVAVRGELASPKSFSRLIHHKDNRNKRETHPRTLGHFGTTQQTTNILPAEDGVFFLSLCKFSDMCFCKPGNAQHKGRKSVTNFLHYSE